MLIDGVWRHGRGVSRNHVRNPATGGIIHSFAGASELDLQAAVGAADAAFESWRDVSPVERGHLLRDAAELLRRRTPVIARMLTIEQGKPLAEARAEVAATADLLEWFGEEARRTYGRVIPSRRPGVRQIVLREPVGVVAAFTPWNFPLSQIARKVGPALAAGCTMVLKAPEETPLSPCALIEALVDAGLPAGVVNLVFGVPAEISSFLIPHPAVRKLSFTGSVPVGKQLAAMAGQHMKRATMELGGHGAALIFADADVDAAADALAAFKYRNAGQVCVSPTRFLVERPVYDRFVDRFVARAGEIRVGDGLAADTRMGPLVSERRRDAIEALVADATARGARIAAGGERIGNEGFFFAPTVLTDLDPAMTVMNEEPFGPIALMLPFDDGGQAVAEANRLPYGLASYAWTRSQATAEALSRRIETGMLTINHLGLGLPELPFGGVRDSGYGSEGGTEAVDAYLTTRIISQDHS